MEQGESYVLPLMEDEREIIKQDVPSTTVSCAVFTLVPIQSQETLGWDLHIDSMLLLSHIWQG